MKNIDFEALADRTSRLSVPFDQKTHDLLWEFIVYQGILYHLPPLGSSKRLKLSSKIQIEIYSHRIDILKSILHGGIL